MSDDQPSPASRATVSTGRADRYAKQLASHLGRRHGGEWDAGARAGWIDLGAGRVRLTASDTALELEITAGAGMAGAELDRLEEVVGSHLIRFGEKDELSVEWRRGEGGSLPPNTKATAAATALSLIPVAPEQVVAGQPRTGTAVLGTFGGREVGVWEMTVGAMRDTEADELFVVLSGSARVDFADGAPSLEIAAGDVVVLAGGTQTVWTVREPLRKVYLA